MNASDDDSSLELSTLRVLSDTRSVFSPSEQDAERVRAALRRSLTAQNVDRRADAAPRAVSQRASVVKLVVSAATIAAFSAGVGYVAGFRAGSARPPGPALIASTPLDDGTATKPSLPAHTETATVPRSANTATTQALPSPPAAAMRNTAVRAHGAARNTQISVPEGDPPPSAATAEALLIELDGVRRVERALRDGQPRLALSVLDELERTVPNGQLTEERLAAFAVARCGVGLGSPQLLRQQFTSAYPDSVYSTRVTQACGAKQNP